jgi:hypothetical protein
MKKNYTGMLLSFLSIITSIIPWIIFSKIYCNQVHMIFSIFWLVITVMAVRINRQKIYRFLFLLAPVAFLPNLYIAAMFFNFSRHGFAP